MQPSASQLTVAVSPANKPLKELGRDVVTATQNSDYELLIYNSGELHCLCVPLINIPAVGIAVAIPAGVAKSWIEPVLPCPTRLRSLEDQDALSEDMVEALEWMLPVASSPEESIIVLLDWFSGHLTDEIEECEGSE